MCVMCEAVMAAGSCVTWFDEVQPVSDRVRLNIQERLEQITSDVSRPVTWSVWCVLMMFELVDPNIGAMDRYDDLTMEQVGHKDRFKMNVQKHLFIQSGIVSIL